MRRRHWLATIGLLALVACHGDRTPTTQDNSPLPSSSAPSSPGSPELLYATKSGTRVTVLRRSLATKKDTTILTYVERVTAEHSGNKWEETAPSVALNPEGTKLAFAAADGLHVADLGSGRRRTLISRTARDNGEQAARWSPSLGNGVFGLFAPQWSGDGRFISFVASHYEGHSIWFVDLRTGRPFLQEGLADLSYADPVLGNLSWAAAGASSVVPHSGTQTGIVLSKIGDPSAGTFVHVNASMVADAALSKDARLIAVTIGSHADSSEAETLAIFRRGETTRTIVDRQGVKSSPVIDAGGDIWWVEAATLYRRESSRSAAVAQLDRRYGWSLVSIDESAIALVGNRQDPAVARLLLLDRDGNELAVHETRTDYVTLLRFTASDFDGRS